MNNYTSQTRKVLSLAQSESRRLGHNFLGSEQILVGILGESSCTAAKLLNSVSLTLDAAKEKVEARIGRGPGYVASEIPHTPNVRSIIEIANFYAADSPIAPEHLLLGILDLAKGIGFQVLEEFSPDIAALRSQLIETIRQTDPQNLEIAKTSYTIETEALFKAINLSALPQENGRWACALSSPLISKSILVYGNTKAETVSLALRELATKIEINGITD